MKKGPFDVIPEIRGERIVLKRIGPESAPGLLELVESEAVCRYLPTFLTASSMVENRRSARVPEKNGFSHVVSGVCEDWGFEDPVPVDKWIR